jgi:hypothetical protein
MNNFQKNLMRKKYKDTDRDGVPNKWDCQPLNKFKQDTNNVNINSKIYPFSYFSNKYGPCLLHLTDKKNINSILKNGFIVSNNRGQIEGVFTRWGEIKERHLEMYRFNKLKGSLLKIDINPSARTFCDESPGIFAESEKFKSNKEYELMYINALVKSDSKYAYLYDCINDKKCDSLLSEIVEEFRVNLNFRKEFVKNLKQELIKNNIDIIITQDCDLPVILNQKVITKIEYLGEI